MIREDFTFRYRNAYFQVEAHEGEPRMPGSRITIEHRLDGSARYRWQESYLEPTPLAGKPERRPKLQEVRQPGSQSPAGKPASRPPSPDHPWRRYPIRAGRAAAAGVSAAPPLRSGAALTPYHPQSP